MRIKSYDWREYTMADYPYPEDIRHTLLPYPNDLVRFISSYAHTGHYKFTATTTSHNSTGAVIDTAAQYDMWVHTNDTPKDYKRRRLKEVIQSRCFPGILIQNTRHPLPMGVDEREERARETLRHVIGEDKWRKFLKNGFIQVRGKSGKYYQLFPAQNFTKVYENGVLIERLCIVLLGNFPPTDSLIMRYLIILNNEADFWKRAIKHGVPAKPQYGFVTIRYTPQEYDPSLPLTEITKRIRSA